MDELRRELQDRHPQIRLTDFDFYNVSIFNRVEQNRGVLLVIKSWDCVHPMMKVLPVDWDHTIPFGLLYPTQPSDTVNRFLDAVKKVI